MTYEKLTNTLTAELRKYNPSRKRFSRKFLRNLFSRYKVKEVCIEHFCCLGEDVPCWYDVEGPSHGWLFLDHKPEEMSKVLMDYVFGHFMPYEKQLYKRKIFYYRKNDYLMITIPIRDLALFDIHISFSLVNDKSD